MTMIITITVAMSMTSLWLNEATYTIMERKANNAASAKKSRQIKQQAEAMSDKQVEEMKMDKSRANTTKLKYYDNLRLNYENKIRF